MSGTIGLDWDVYSQDQTWPDEYYSVIVATGNDINAMDAGDIVFSETMDAYGAYVTRTVDLTSYAGQKIYVAFRHHNCNDWFRLNIDNVNVYENNVIDAMVTDIVTPGNENDCALTGSEQVSIKIFNNGGEPISDFEVSYAVNGGTPVTETVTASVASASSHTYTFATPANFGTMGEYSIVASVSLTDDGDASNDTQTKNIRNSDAYIEIVATTDASGGQSWELLDNNTGMVVTDHGAYQWDIVDTTRICVYDTACYAFNYMGEMSGSIQVFYNGALFYETTGGTVPATINLPVIGNGCPAVEYDAAEIAIPSIVQAGNHDVTFELKNKGTDVITKVDFDFDIDGGTPVNTVLTGLSIAPGTSATLTASAQANLASVGAYEITVQVNSANDEVNPNTADDMVAATINVVDEVPSKVVVLEEGTGTWCGWCPRGTVALWNMENNYPESSIGIAVHNGDPMVVTEYDAGIGTFISGYPGGVVDRVNTMDPGVFENGYNNRIDMIPPVIVDIQADFNASTRNLHVEVTSTFVISGEGSYKVNAVVLEDGVTGTGAQYAQANYYSGGGNGNLSGAGFDWHNESDPVPAEKMEYDHVARAILGGFNGTENSIPATVVAGQPYTQTYDYTVSPDYDVANMHVAAMIHGQNNEIVNAKKADVSVSVRDAKSVIASLSIAPNPANDVAFVNLAVKEEAKVAISVLDATGKQVLVDNSTLSAGSYVKELDTRALSNGLYLINLNVNGIVTTKRLVVNH